MKRICLLVAFAVALGGCNFGQDSEVIAYQITRPQFESVITGIEELAGPVLTEGQQGTAVKVAGHIQTGASVLAPIAGAIPGAQGVGIVLGALGTLAGAIGTFVSRRKVKKVAVAAVKAADALPGGGKAITKAASDEGVSDLIHDVYVRR